MAWELGPYFDYSVEAGADLSALQYHFCKLNTSTGKVIAIAAATDKALGVLQNKPVLGATAVVRMFGISKVVGDANLAIDDTIGTSADGQADAKIAGTDTTEYVFGRVIADNTAAGGIVSAAIDCMAPRRAT